MNGDSAAESKDPLTSAINNAAHWHYKSEGELNLVLSYRGDLSALYGKVLRITKRAIVDKAHPPSPGSVPKYHKDSVLAHFADGSTANDCGESFLREVIKPLLGPAAAYLYLPQRVRLHHSFLETLRAAVDHLRPHKRRSATIIDIKDQDAYLMDDLSILLSPDCGPQHQPPMLGVEIKPKWGFLPSSPFIPEGHVKRTVCRFCMQQTLKLKQGHVHHKSQYCPLDLYSSSANRQHHAMRALLAHPQNNIKIFMNGSVIYTGSLGGQSEAHRLSHNDLTAALAPVISPSDASHHVLERFVELVSTALSESGVLSVLQSLQSSGDAWDIEAIIKLHNALLSAEHKGLDLANHQLALSLSQEDEARFGGPITVGEALKKIRSFLQAATVKDCSLMLSFAHHAGAVHHATITQHNRRFEYRVAIIDLDAKPVRNIPYYHLLDTEIVSQFVLANPSPHPCRPPTPPRTRAHHAPDSSP